MITFILSGLLNIELMAQPVLEWVNHFDFGSNSERPVKLAVNSTGDCFIGGISTDDSTHDNIVIMKIDGAGNTVWNNSISNDEHDVLGDMIRDSNDNIFITGRLGNLYLSENGFMQKTNSSGFIEWSDTVNGNGSAISLGDSNYIYALYESNGILVIKYDSQGQRILQVHNDTFTIDNIISPQSIALDKNHNIYVAGKASNDNDGEYFLKKFKQNGEFLWDVRYNPSVLEDYVHYLMIDDSSDIYILGDIEGGTASMGVALVKYDSSGNFLWDKQVISFPSDPYGLVLDSDNAPVICGFLESGNSFLTYFVTKYSASGQEVWTKYIDTTCWPGPSAALIADKIGGIYFTGALEAIGPSTSDIVLSKYNSAGDELWEIRYNSPANGFDIPIQIDLDQVEDIYITAKSYDSITNSDILTLKYSQPTGILSPVHSSGKFLEVFPNPAFDKLHITVQSATTEKTGLKIFNVLGIMVKSLELNGTEAEIDISDLQQGIYFLRCCTETGVETSRLIKE
ncbi:MAG TPA: T9SS type A sorting domain-containing protein [Chitinophagales bacterium]|nr:T9SS type A sorting domain-containing protein [Chitinophagales bacterium]